MKISFVHSLKGNQRTTVECLKCMRHAGNPEDETHCAGGANCTITFALCIQLHLDLFAHHGDESPCQNVFGLPLVIHSSHHRISSGLGFARGHSPAGWSVWVV